MGNVLLDLLKLVATAIPIFSGFLYYIGRRFAESYYETLGVPHQALNFSVADYLSKSVQSWMFIIAIVLTYLVFILWRNVSKKPESPPATLIQVTEKKSKFEVLVNIGRIIIKPKKADPQLLILGYFFYSACSLLVLLVWILPTAEPNFPAEAIVETMMPVFSIGLAWMIIKDPPTMEFVGVRKRLKQVFIVCIIITFTVSVQLLPHGVGRLVGVYQTNPYRIDKYFPSVNITANKLLWSQDIKWVEQDGMYATQDRLILIMANNDGLFVRQIIEEQISEVFTIKKISETYYIPNSNIEGLSINIPGQFPKVDEN